MSSPCRCCNIYRGKNLSFSARKADKLGGLPRRAVLEALPGFFLSLSSTCVKEKRAKKCLPHPSAVPGGLERAPVKKIPGVQRKTFSTQQKPTLLSKVLLFALNKNSEAREGPEAKGGKSGRFWTCGLPL